jgi:hypothetical protein
MNFQEEKPKTRKYLRREREILNMTEEELLKYIEKCNKSIKRLEKQLVSLRETEKLSNEERERKAHEYAMKNFPELEEKYQKWLKIRMEKLKEQKSKQIDDNVVDKQQKKNKKK